MVKESKNIVRSYCLCEASPELIARSYTNILNRKPSPNGKKGYPSVRLRFGFSILSGAPFRAEEFICSLIVTEDSTGKLQIYKTRYSYSSVENDLLPFMKKYNSKTLTPTDLALCLTDPNELIRAITRFYNPN